MVSCRVVTASMRLLSAFTNGGKNYVAKVRNACVPRFRDEVFPILEKRHLMRCAFENPLAGMSR